LRSAASPIENRFDRFRVGVQQRDIVSTAGEEIAAGAGQSQIYRAL